MFRRHLASALEAAAAANPVVTLTGPRQSGKTTLVRSLFPHHGYVSLERPDLRLRAAEDPAGLLASSDRLVLDEIQRVPELLSYIQVLVDEDARPGRFILTGSQNVLLMESVSQTLAGRTAFLRLYPLSLRELRSACRIRLGLSYSQCVLQLRRPVVEVFAHPYPPGEVAELARLAMLGEAGDPDHWPAHARNDEHFSVGGPLDNFRESSFGVTQSEGGLHTVHTVHAPRPCRACHCAIVPTRCPSRG